MFLIVDDSFSLSSQNATDAEKLARADVWARVLFGIIPEHRLQDAFDLAFQKHDSSFPVNAYDIKLAWEQIETAECAKAKIELEAEKLSNPVKFCENKANHLNADGEILKMNPFDTTQDVVVPCWSCRRKAYDDVWERFLDSNGRKDLPPLEIVETLANLVKPILEVEEISMEEINTLEAEHNGLVSQIAKDAAKDLLIVWDEGANCFVRANYRARTFSAEVVRKAIEDYRRILGGK